MGNLVKAAKEGNQKELYEGVLLDLVATLENGCEAYTKPGIVKQIIAVQELIDKLPKPRGETPLERARRLTA